MTSIGLLGFDFNCPNLGCEALSYSFINMVSEISQDELEIHVFSYSDATNFSIDLPNIELKWHRLHMKSPSFVMKLKRAFDSMDCIFDVTYGDGFSDIYGSLWNANTDFAKQLANASKAPLILLPQTYGPYGNAFLRRWAAHIVRHAAVAMSRDDRSAREMAELGCDGVVVATDLAFALPFNKDKYTTTMGNETKVGLNVSSLLWDRGHGIRLEVDYREYCRRVIARYAGGPGYEVHLIPHVIDRENPDALENDSRVCRLLAEEFPATVLAPNFDSPVDAKSYISNMDVFIGARMHSTIASMSSGVPTIPFSYSKKFEGLFGNLDYPYVVSGKNLSTEEAVRLTERYVDNRDVLREGVRKSLQGVEPRLEVVRSKVAAALCGDYGGRPLRG